MNTEARQTRHILLADDDIDDRELFQEALAELQLDVDLVCMIDGLSLMNHLSQPRVQLPDMLFLDLNMPFKNGFECLDEIRSSSVLQQLYVVCYSTTASPSDIDRVRKSGANLFLQKPDSFEDLKKLLQRLLQSDLKELNNESSERRLGYI